MARAPEVIAGKRIILGGVVVDVGEVEDGQDAKQEVRHHKHTPVHPRRHAPPQTCERDGNVMGTAVKLSETQ